MRHFLKIADNCDVLPLLLAVQQRPSLWNQFTLRTQTPGTPHAEVDDILLRFQDLSLYEQSGGVKDIIDNYESINFPAFAMLPQARPLIFGLMARVEGERLGRCMITRLAPGRRIARHADGGEHAAYYERYHIVLQADTGSLFETGGEVVRMRPGECWWFDNGIEHEIENQGDIDRVHLIVDIRSWRFGGVA